MGETTTASSTMASRMRKEVKVMSGPPAPPVEVEMPKMSSGIYSGRMSS
jgi:hypothetical protein